MTLSNSLPQPSLSRLHPLEALITFGCAPNFPFVLAVTDDEVHSQPHCFPPVAVLSIHVNLYSVKDESLKPITFEIQLPILPTEPRPGSFTCLRVHPESHMILLQNQHDVAVCQFPVPILSWIQKLSSNNFIKLVQTDSQLEDVTTSGFWLRLLNLPYSEKCISSLSLSDVPSHDGRARPAQTTVDTPREMNSLDSKTQIIDANWHPFLNSAIVLLKETIPSYDQGYTDLELEIYVVVEATDLPHIKWKFSIQLHNVGNDDKSQTEKVIGFQWGASTLNRSLWSDLLLYILTSQGTVYFVSPVIPFTSLWPRRTWSRFLMELDEISQEQQENGSFTEKHLLPNPLTCAWLKEIESHGDFHEGPQKKMHVNLPKKNWYLQPISSIFLPRPNSPKREYVHVHHLCDSPLWVICRFSSNGFIEFWASSTFVTSSITQTQTSFKTLSETLPSAIEFDFICETDLADEMNKENLQVFLLQDQLTFIVQTQKKIHTVEPTWLIILNSKTFTNIQTSEQSFVYKNLLFEKDVKTCNSKHLVQVANKEKKEILVVSLRTPASSQKTDANERAFTHEAKHSIILTSEWISMHSEISHMLNESEEQIAKNATFNAVNSSLETLKKIKESLEFTFKDLRKTLEQLREKNSNLDGIKTYSEEFFKGLKSMETLLMPSLIREKNIILKKINVLTAEVSHIESKAQSIREQNDNFLATENINERLTALHSKQKNLNMRILRIKEKVQNITDNTYSNCISDCLMENLPKQLKKSLEMCTDTALIILKSQIKLEETQKTDVSLETDYGKNLIAALEKIKDIYQYFESERLQCLRLLQEYNDVTKVNNCTNQYQM